MSDKLTKQDIDDLIYIGKIPLGKLVYEGKFFSEFRKKNHINRTHWDIWYGEIDKLSDKDLVYLFKGLVHVDGEMDGGSGGSVSAGIWAYRAIQKRGIDKDNKIADYGLINCNNPYIPFGMSTNAKSTKEHYLNLIIKETSRRERAERENKRRKRVNYRGEKRKAAIAELRKLDYDTRGQIIKKMAVKYSHHSIEDKFSLMANNEKYPPEYYPKDWALVTENQIKKLPNALIRKMYDKLSTKTKGPWRNLSIILAKYDEGL
jgi:hypothetical protein